MFAHILYGTSSLTHGGLQFDARSAARRGQQVSLEVIVGSSLGVSVEPSAIGAGAITAQVASNTTESALIDALRAVRTFNNIARVTQTSGDGSAVVAALAKTKFEGPAGGLLQHLEATLGILGWNDRDLIATGSARGLLFPIQSEPLRKEPSREENDVWKGLFQVGIAFQSDNNDFITQNALVDLFREHLYYTCKVFAHPSMCGTISASLPEAFEFSNRLKPEAAGTTKDRAHLGILGTFEMFYEQPPFDINDLPDLDISTLRIGLFRQPTEEEPGGPGADLDQQIDLPTQ